MFGAWVFDDVVNQIEDYNLVLVDQIGFNEQLPDQGAEDFDSASHRLHTFLSEHNLSNIIMIGHSMGGFFAQHFGKNHPNKLSSLVLIATSRPKDFSESYRANSIDILEALFSLNEENFIGITVKSIFSSNYLSNPSKFEYLSKSILADMPSLNVCKSQLEALDISVETKSNDVVEQSTNVLVLIAEGDKVISPSMSKKLNKKYPFADIKTFPGEHMFFMEQPEVLLSLLQAWVNNGDEE